MFGIFSKKKKKQTIDPEAIQPLTVDIHSHLLPGLDDGAATMDETLTMIREFVRLGYRKLVTTPHVMGDFYTNTKEDILSKLAEVKTRLKEEQIDIELEAAAEYYLDESLIEKLQKEEPLLTFGDKYLLFETSYMNASSFLKEAVFMMQTQGYKPVMAHPERYVYLFNAYEELTELSKMNVLLQINANSLFGYYSKASQKQAERLIDDGLVAFVGSDCHKIKHLNTLAEGRDEYYFRKVLTQSVLNNTL
ncbi:CpsB/CapC family capsule biosynthesis tyrosine phosphatase [Rapidithrix thailandica]|uniref:protein-tyrosine-phosphatase n=1 Tax=Rapidithrix thailandica TaxID=413964 RepID=A0AAW9RY81_9BACT